MHYQREPHAEVKVIRCARGSIFDVVIDLRQHSLTYHQWECFELTEDNHRQLYVPKGFAHGFQTLSDEVEVTYLISEPYRPEGAAGIRYNDSRFGIKWPLEVTEISDTDQQWPDLTD